MKNDSPQQLKTRLIHVRLTEDLHKKVRIRVAESDTTIQRWVVQAIEKDLERDNSETKE